MLLYNRTVLQPFLPRIVQGSQPWICLRRFGILSFIPVEQLRTLYGVDRTLFDLMLNIRYKEADLYRANLEICMWLISKIGLKK